MHPQTPPTAGIESSAPTPIFLPEGPGGKLITSWEAYERKHLPARRKGQWKKTVAFLHSIFPRGANEREIALKCDISVKSITGVLQTPEQDYRVIYRDGREGSFTFVDERGRPSESTGLLYFLEPTPGAHPVCPGYQERARLRLTWRAYRLASRRTGNDTDAQRWAAWIDALEVMEGQTFSLSAAQKRWAEFYERFTLMNRIFPNEH